MCRIKWFVLVLIVATMTSVGCSGQDNNAGSNEKKFDAKQEISKLEKEDITKKVADYLEKGDLEKAIAVGEAGIKKEPDNVGTMFNLSNAYFFKNDPNNMLKIAKLMEKKSPNNPIILNQLAWALIESGNSPAEGVKKAELAMSIMIRQGQGVDESIGDTRAYGIYKSGNKQQAIDEWNKLLPRTQNGEIYLHLAEALVSVGQKDKAKPIVSRGLMLIKFQLKDAGLTTLETKHLEEAKTKLEKLEKQIGKAKV